MKKLLLIVFFLVGVMHLSKGQTYSSAFGLRIGPAIGATAKIFIQDQSAVELIIERRYGDGLQLIGLYEFHGRVFGKGNCPNGIDCKRLLWYVGGGAHAGRMNEAYVPYKWGWAKNKEDHLVLGVDGVMGIEYAFPRFPMSISVDWKPAYNIVGHRGEWLDQGGVSLRFTID